MKTLTIYYLNDNKGFEFKCIPCRRLNYGNSELGVVYEPISSCVKAKGFNLLKTFNK